MMQGKFILSRIEDDGTTTVLCEADQILLQTEPSFQYIMPIDFLKQVPVGGTCRQSQDIINTIAESVTGPGTLRPLVVEKSLKSIRTSSEKIERPSAEFIKGKMDKISKKLEEAIMKGARQTAFAEKYGRPVCCESCSIGNHSLCAAPCSCGVCGHNESPFHEIPIGEPELCKLMTVLPTDGPVCRLGAPIQTVKEVITFSMEAWAKVKDQYKRKSDCKIVYDDLNGTIKVELF